MVGQTPARSPTALLRLKGKQEQVLKQTDLALTHRLMKAVVHSYSWSNLFVAFIPTDDYELKLKTSNDILHFLQVKKKNLSLTCF